MMSLYRLVAKICNSVKAWAISVASPEPVHSHEIKDVVTAMKISAEDACTTLLSKDPGLYFHPDREQIIHDECLDTDRIHDAVESMLHEVIRSEYMQARIEDLHYDQLEQMVFDKSPARFHGCSDENFYGVYKS